MQRFYYKSKDDKGFLNLKSPLTDENYIQITEEEFNELTKPKIPELTAEQKAAQEKAKKVAEYKAYLEKTDYIVLKIAEAQSEGETSTVSQLRSIYSEQLKLRKQYRAKLNS